MYLVCTHSRHDTCCALRGRPAAAAFDEVRPGRVWECSHLGGERFAANLLVLPTGLLYGRVIPEHAPDVVAATEAGAVVGPLLRGRVGLPPAAQAALVHAHEQLGVQGDRALTVLSTSAVEGGQARVLLAGPEGPLAVTVRVERVAADGLTCADPRPGSYLAYRAVDLSAAQAAPGQCST